MVIHRWSDERILSWLSKEGIAPTSEHVKIVHLIAELESYPFAIIQLKQWCDKADGK